MRFGVFGVGGVGGYFGGKLAQSGEDVSFIARGEHLKALQTNGLQVESDQGDFWLKSVQATGEPHDAGRMDVILVGVKAWQVSEAAQAMRPMVGPDTFVVPLQNGVEAPSRLAEVLVKTAPPEDYDMIFISGIGTAYPLLRTHNLLNNLHPLLGSTPLVLFYPGKYDGQSLRLFGLLKDNPYYRAFRLVD